MYQCLKFPDILVSGSLQMFECNRGNVHCTLNGNGICVQSSTDTCQKPGKENRDASLNLGPQQR